jgi:hypothetical protein
MIQWSVSWIHRLRSQHPTGRSERIFVVLAAVVVPDVDPCGVWICDQLPGSNLPMRGSWDHHSLQVMSQFLLKLSWLSCLLRVTLNSCAMYTQSSLPGGSIGVASLRNQLSRHAWTWMPPCWQHRKLAVSNVTSWFNVQHLQLKDSVVFAHVSTIQNPFLILWHCWNPLQRSSFWGPRSMPLVPWWMLNPRQWYLCGN